MRFIAASLLLSVAAIPSLAQHDPAALQLFLSRALENITKQPDYTCLETIERIRQAANGRQRVDDTLRLEVALVGPKEMFGWPGSREFEDKDVTQLVTTGMFGNGNFGLFAQMLFNQDHPPFTYAGRETVDGKTAVKYEFRVPRGKSGYNLRVNDKQDVSGFHGSFSFELGTLDLRRLEVHAHEIPEHLGLMSAEDRIEYARLPIGENSFVLPVESTQVMITSGVNGLVSRNHVRFSGCKKFTGESSLVFLDEDFEDAPLAAPVIVRQVELPHGAEVALGLRTPIDLAAGYAGAAVEARLNSDIKVGREVIVPKGAMAKGRIVRLERHERAFVLGLRFTDLEWSGGHAKLDLAFDRPVFQRYIYREENSGDIVIDSVLRRLADTLLLWRTR